MNEEHSGATAGLLGPGCASSAPLGSVIVQGGPAAAIAIDAVPGKPVIRSLGLARTATVCPDTGSARVPRRDSWTTCQRLCRDVSLRGLLGFVRSVSRGSWLRYGSTACHYSCR